MKRALVQWTGGVVVAVLVATTGVRAQLTRTANLYEDPELTRILVETTTGMAVIAALDPTMIMLTAPLIATNIVWHELLTIARIDAEMNTMAALMTDALREQDVQIRAAVTAGNRLIMKLQADIAYYEQRRPQFQSGPPTALALQREYAVYQEVRARLKRLQAGGDIDLVTKGERLTAAFDDMRRLVLGRGLFSRVQFIQNAKGLQPALRAFGEAAFKADQLIAQKHRLQEAGQAIEVDASPMQQLRLLVNNTSADDANNPQGLVFFVRTWERADGNAPGSIQDCRGTYTLPLAYNVDGSVKSTTDASGATVQARDDRWTTVWPKTATPEFGPVGAGPNASRPGDVRLPSTVSLPVTVGGRIEVRVATYGPLRKRIRWADVVGRVVRPETSSMPRGFYWFAYEAVQTDMTGGYGNLKSRWFPVDERYTWLLSGAWSEENAGPLKARVESTQGDARRELRVSALGTPGESLLTMSSDRATYCLPTRVDLILSDPFLSAEIKGTARVRHVTQNEKNTQEESEDGSGQIGITMQRW